MRHQLSIVLILVAPTAIGYSQTAVGNVAIVEDDGSIVSHENPFNLDGRSIRFSPNAAGGYDVTASDLVWDNDLGAPPTLDRPLAQSTEMRLGFTFPFAGKTWNSVVVNATGSLSFGWREDATARERYFFLDD